MIKMIKMLESGPGASEEVEAAQELALNLNADAIDVIRRRVAEQESAPSLSECESCGEEIPLARQKAVPGVTMCIDCKQRHERQAV
jgi:phage/conjugal plasmid C-4 type zinc finger TraR family protein